MAAKIIAFIVTLLFNIGIGVVVFFMMLMGMNGFSESDANYGFGTYIVLAVLVSLATATLAAVTTHLLIKRAFGAVAASLIGIVCFTLIGGVLKVVCSIIGILVADFVRVNY